MQNQEINQYINGIKKSNFKPIQNENENKISKNFMNPNVNINKINNSDDLSTNFSNCKRRIQKNIFTIQEDSYLLSLVEKIGDKNWSEISRKMREKNYNRTNRQCRDRYIHYLDPNLKNDLSWSPEEDDLLILNVNKYGNKWKYLENIFPGRTEVSLRNRYRKLQRNKSKEERKDLKKKNIMSDYFAFLDHMKKNSKKRKRTENNSNKTIDIVRENSKKNDIDNLLENSNMMDFFDDEDLKNCLF